MTNENEYLFFPEIDDRAQAGRLLDIAFINTARRAGIPEELIYAVHKCGFMITEHNQDQFGKKEKSAWSRAIDEYRQGKGKLPI